MEATQDLQNDLFDETPTGNGMNAGNDSSGLGTGMVAGAAEETGPGNAEDTDDVETGEDEELEGDEEEDDDMEEDTDENAGDDAARTAGGM